MTGNRNNFHKLQAKTRTVTFGNDDSSKVLGKGMVTLGSKDAATKDVLLIENMRHNLLNVSQMCDQGHVLTFTSKDCKIRREDSGKFVATNSRTPNNIYILVEIKKERCCLGREDESWLWHRRMGHILFGNLFKISKHQAIREILEIQKPKTDICESCQHGKQTRVEFKTKEHSTTRPLELVHIDLCGPTRSKGLNGEEYFMLLIDDFTRMPWVFLLKKKSYAFGYFKIFKELVENEAK